MEQALQFAEVTRGKQRQMLLHQFHRLRQQRRRGRLRFQLQAQTFCRVAGTDPCGLHVLQAAQADRKLVGFETELVRKQFHQLFQRGLQIAVLVQRVDQRRYDLPIAKGKVTKRELRVEVIAQRAGRHLLRRKILVVVVARGRTPVAVAAGISQQIEVARRPLVAIVTRRRLGTHGRGAGFHRKLGRRRRRLVFVGFFQQRIFLQQALDFGVELEGRKLQQTNRLLQLRSER